MACINVNSRVLSNLNNDDIALSLNQIIDRELAKNVSLMNTGLIDECVNALLELEKERDSAFNAFIPIINPNTYLKSLQPRQSSWKNMNVFARASIIAALLAASAMTANAAYRTATGVDIIENLGNAIHLKLEEWNIINDNEFPESETTSLKSAQIKEENTTEETEREATQTETTAPQIEQIKKSESRPPSTTKKSGYIEQLFGEDDDDEETTAQTTGTPEKTTSEKANIIEPDIEPEKPYVASLEAEFDGFTYDYIYGEELSYKGLRLRAVYSNGEKKDIALGECDYTKSVNMNVTADYTLRVIYESCVLKIDITVRPDEETRGAKRCENDDFEYFLADKGAYVTKFKGNQKDINLDTVDGNSVYAIGSGVFKDSDIQSIKAQNVKKIFPAAFENCDALKSAEFSSDLSFIGHSAFKNSKVEEITLSDNIKEIPESLFENCRALKKVVLGANTKKIGYSAFSECEALETVLNTANITDAAAFAFYNCTLLEADSSLSKLESAGEYAFAYCKKLDFGALSTNINKIGKYAFAYCTKLTEVNIPSGFTSIPEGAFRGAHISTLTLPEGLKIIEDYAFMSTEFRDLTVPDSVERVGTYALYSVRMRTASFGRNIKEMGENAVFKSTRLNMSVYKDTAAYDYAVENKINFTVIE